MSNVWVLVIDHRHGTDTWACATKEKADEILYGYVVEWWGDYPDALGDEIPEDRDLAVKEYFDVSGEGFLLNLETVL